ncbi:hypothetical protein BH18ACT5_BH18ACT5_10390 [soil metagenome]
MIGITRPPGAGKSTLVDQMIRALRRDGKRPGVIVVDPSSPVTGGALLGDRIRMQEHASDEDVFIRSLATRGRLGGLADGMEPVLELLGQEGFAPLLIETVGVGQSEVEVARVADTVVLVLHPGWGDDVQAAKAGLVEVADIFFVNKSDQGNAEAVVRLLEATIAPDADGWRPLVLSGSAVTGDGIDQLLDAIVSHQSSKARPAPPPDGPL